MKERSKMPELPEVETVRRGVERQILNKRIMAVRVLCEKSWVRRERQGVAVEREHGGVGVVDGLVERERRGKVADAGGVERDWLIEQVVGQMVTSLERRGKALLINLSNDWTMMIHLRMTGQLVWVGAEFERVAAGADVGVAGAEAMRFAGGHPTEDFVGKLPSRQTRVMFEFEDGTLYFNDQRKFGFVKVLPTAEVAQDKFIASLGKEPWEMSVRELQGKLVRHRLAPVKAVLLDQKVMAGLGNIYVDEALFFAKVHPMRKAGSLTAREVEQVLTGARQIMEKAIEVGGSTIANYVQADGARGNYLDKFAQVFRREGQECRQCGAKIVKLRVAGRGTHICPNCQKVGKGGTA